MAYIKNYNYMEKIYNITFNQIDKQIQIYFENNHYFSNYSLNQIMEKLEKEVIKISKFDEITNINKKKKKLKNVFDIRKCMNENINKKKLKFNSSYANCISSIWELYPEDDVKDNKSEKDTFQINFYCESKIYKLLLIYFNKNHILINENEDQSNMLIQTEICKIPDKFVKSKSINNINELKNENKIESMNNIVELKNENIIESINNINEIENQNKIEYNNNVHYKKVFILKNIDELDDDFVNLMEVEYINQIFIIFMNINNHKKEENLKSELKNKLSDFLSENAEVDIKKYFDWNNIRILNEYNELSLTILKIYLYFNQIDDYDLFDFINKNNIIVQNIEGLKEEMEQLNKNDHFINIKLCGNSSTGKSTFINTILGEKRSLIEGSSGTSKKNHIFISKKYNLKFIDDLGFDKGDEGKINEEIDDLKNKKHRIIIDKNIELSYGYYNDSRNKINLLLFFSRYDTPYNINSQQLKFMKNIDNKEIPIIFVINFCDDKIFEDKLKYKNNKNRCKSFNNKYLRLLETMAKELEDKEQIQFIKKKKIPINCLNKKGYHSLFKKIYKLFKDSMVKNEIIEKLKSGDNYASPNKDLKNLLETNIFFKDIKSEDIISQQLKESVVLIKDLILKLTGQYSGEILLPWFAIMNSIKKYIYWRPKKEFYPLLTDLVFDIYDIFGEVKKQNECSEFIQKCLDNYFKISENGELDFEEFKNDIIKFRNLFYNLENNFSVKEENQNDSIKEKILKISEDNFSNIGKFFLEEEKKFFENQINDAIKAKSNDKKISIIYDDSYLTENDDDEATELIVVDNISKYKKEFNNIKEKISNYIKKKFGIRHGESIVDNNKDKILLRIFLINLVCKQLIDELCEKSQNIWDFFLNLAEQYNSSVEGLIKLKDYYKE